MNEVIKLTRVIPHPSERQVQCLRGKAEGKNNEQIGAELGISTATVAKEMYALYCLLGVNNAPAAVAIGMSEGWLVVGVGRNGDGKRTE